MEKSDPIKATEKAIICNLKSTPEPQQAMKMTLLPLPLLCASVIATSPDSTVSNTATEARRDSLQCISILSLNQDHNKHFVVSFTV